MLDTTRAAGLFVRLDSKMEGRQAFGILLVDVTAPCKNIVKNTFSVGERSPVQRRTVTVILGVDVEAFFEEVRQADWRVTLS